MKTIASALVLISAINLSAQSIKKVKWLEGTWNRQNVKQGQTASESWKVSGNELTGIGVTLKGVDTVFQEQLSIIKKGKELFYVANVSQNAAPTLFRITLVTKKGFVSENPEHDFPKKITYELNGEMLTATISGDGKTIPFVFKRAQ